jgi:hypothetical protein
MFRVGLGDGLAREEFIQLGDALVRLTSRTVLSSSIFVWRSSKIRWSIILMVDVGCWENR